MNAGQVRSLQVIQRVRVRSLLKLTRFVVQVGTSEKRRMLLMPYTSSVHKNSEFKEDKWIGSEGGHTELELRFIHLPKPRAWDIAGVRD